MVELFLKKILTCHSYVGVHWKTPCIGYFFLFYFFRRIFIVKHMPCPPHMFMHVPTSNPYIIKPFIFNPTCLYIYLTISFTYYQLTFKYCVTYKYCVQIPIVAIFIYFSLMFWLQMKKLCHYLYLFNDQNIIKIYIYIYLYLQFKYM